ncbi:AGAP012459-PA, partial [Anopheles gambiae str. PEST]
IINMQHKSKQEKTTSFDSSFFPECWSDDRRMGVLLAEFRPRQLNIASYDSKMKFWKDLILSSCRESGSSVVSVTTLKERFRRKGTVPYCLNTVFHDMLSKRELCSDNLLKDHGKTGVYGFNLWTVGQLIKTPLVWSYETVRAITGFVNFNESDSYIVKSIAVEHIKIIENVVATHNLQNKTMKYEDFLFILFQSSNITRNGVGPPIIFLEKEKRLTTKSVIIDDTKTFLIKFASIDGIAQPITSIEKSIYEIEQRENRLMEDITSIEHDISQTMEKVRQHIQNGQKQMAKTLLKKKHILEKSMQLKITALDTLQGILQKIHNCQSDKNVIKAYQLGTDALKNVLNTSGITIEQLDNTVTEMKNVLEQHNEMLSMISAVPIDDIDELELELELGDLIDMKLTESNIDKHNISTPALVPPVENRPSNAHDFDTEIEKRLAALRVDIESSKLASNAQ